MPTIEDPFDEQTSRNARKSLVNNTAKSGFAEATALLTVIQAGNFKELQVELTAKNSIEKAYTAQMLSRIVHPQTLIPALHHVAAIAQLEYIKDGVTLNQLKNCKAPDGVTALHWATLGRALHQISDNDTLTKPTAKQMVTCMGPHQETALHWAAENRCLQQVEQLTFEDLICNQNQKGIYPLHFAAKTGEIKLVKVTADQLLTYKDRLGRSALAEAAEHQNLHFLQPIAKTGETVTADQLSEAGPCIEDPEMTPLHWALSYEPGYVQGIKLHHLQNHDPANKRILLKTALVDDEKLVKLLLQTGIDPSKLDFPNMSCIEALITGRKPANPKITKLFMEASHPDNAQTLKKLAHTYANVIDSPNLALWISQELSRIQNIRQK